MDASGLTARTAAQLARIQGADYWLYLLAAAENAPPGLLAQLMDSLTGEPSAAALLGRRWAQRDPAGVLAFLKSHPSPKQEVYTPSASRGQQGRSLLQLQKILTQEWLRKDPEGLIAALSGKESKASDLKTMKQETVRLLVDTDAGRSVDLMLEWKLRLNTADGPALVSWVQTHPREAAEKILRRNLGSWDAEGSVLLKETIKTLAATDPGGALKMKLQDSSYTNSMLYLLSTGIIAGWAQRDLPAVAAFLADSQNGLTGQRKGELSAYLMHDWGAKDPSAALAWTDAQLTGDDKNRALFSLLSSVAAADPSQALDYMDRLPPGRDRDRIFGEVVKTSLKKNDKSQAAAMLQWMTSLPDPIQRDTALNAGAGALMKSAPDEFLAWLKTPEGSTQAPFGALQETARSLSHDNANAKALEWAAGLRPEAAPLIRKDLIERWFWSDFAAPTAWIRNLPSGDARADSITTATTYLAQQGSGGQLHEWLDSLPAADSAAVVEGIQKSSIADPKQKAELLAKYAK